MLEHKYGMLVEQALEDFRVDAFYAAAVIEKARSIITKRDKKAEK